MPMRLAVVGGIAAGMSAAARARRLDPAAEIVVLEKGSVPSYGACGLPYWLEGRVRDWRDLVALSGTELAERRIDVRLNTEVAAIEHARRSLLLRGGGSVGYDKLVIATGALPRYDEIAGSNHERVFSIHNLQAAERLHAYLASTRPGHARIAGAGYMGLEAADALHTRGWRVTLMHAGTHLLGREDPWLTARLAAHLERCGVELRHGMRITSAEPPPPGDLLLLATGLRPNTALAEAAGVRGGITGAIEVSDRMETSLTGVFAAGDCAEVHHLVSGRPAWIPLGTTANKMGRVAGAAATGARDRFRGVVGTSILRVCGLDIGMTGLSTAKARGAGLQAVSVEIETRDRPRYWDARPISVQLAAERGSGRLLGGVVMGEDGVAGRINVIATALTRRMNVEEFADLDLAYAPPFAPVWDPLLVAAQQLRKAL